MAVHHTVPREPIANGQSHAQKNSAMNTRALPAEMEKAHTEHILTLTGGRVSGSQGAARMLGVPRSTLQYKLRKHKIVPKNFIKLY